MNEVLDFAQLAKLRDKYKVPSLVKLCIFAIRKTPQLLAEAVAEKLLPKELEDDVTKTINNNYFPKR